MDNNLSIEQAKKKINIINNNNEILIQELQKLNLKIMSNEKQIVKLQEYIFDKCDHNMVKQPKEYIYDTYHYQCSKCGYYQH